MICPDRDAINNPSRGALGIGRELTTAIEPERGLESDALLGGRSLGVCGLSGVESVDVCLVVLLVVKLHDLAGNKGLEGIVAVGEIRQSVGHDWR